MRAVIRLFSLGLALAAMAALQLVAGARADVTATAGDPADPHYWRYCSIDGFLSSACGGTVSSCPPGTEMASLTWLGTCRNPEDGKDYVISYNDCCGKASRSASENTMS